MSGSDIATGFGIGFAFAATLVAVMSLLYGEKEKKPDNTDNTVILCGILKDSKISNSAVESICANAQEGQEK